MNKFLMLFVLSVLTLGIQSSAMEVVKKEATNEEKFFIDKYGKKKIDALSNELSTRLLKVSDENGLVREKTIKEITCRLFKYVSICEDLCVVDNENFESVREYLTIFKLLNPWIEELFKTESLNENLYLYIYLEFCKEHSKEVFSSEEWCLLSKIAFKLVEEGQRKQQVGEKLSN